MAETDGIIKVTDQGIVQLEKYRVEWKEYAKKISDIFEGGVKL